MKPIDFVCICVIFIDHRSPNGLARLLWLTRRGQWSVSAWCVQISSYNNMHMTLTSFKLIQMQPNLPLPAWFSAWPPPAPRCHPTLQVVGQLQHPFPYADLEQFSLKPLSCVSFLSSLETESYKISRNNLENNISQQLRWIKTFVIFLKLVVCLFVRPL